MGKNYPVDILPFKELPVLYAAIKDQNHSSLWRLADPKTHSPLIMREYILND